MAQRITVWVLLVVAVLAFSAGYQFASLRSELHGQHLPLGSLESQTRQRLAVLGLGSRASGPLSLPPVSYNVVQTPTLVRLPPELEQMVDPIAPDVEWMDALLAPGERIVVATTSCGQTGLDEMMAWLKSVLVFGASSVSEAARVFDFRLFVDKFTQRAVHSLVSRWRLADGSRLKLNITFYDATAMTDMLEFRPCASARLALPEVLTDVDRVIYIDRDALVLDDLRLLWAHARRFNERQMVAIAVETDKPAKSFYRVRSATVNPWGLAGLNSGVMVCDLNKMRSVDTNATFAVLARERVCKAGFCLGDQDILNAWLHDEPDRVVPLGCRWNYRDDCRGSERISILHLNRQSHRLMLDSFPARMFETMLRWPQLLMGRSFINTSHFQSVAFETEAQQKGIHTGWQDII